MRVCVHARVHVFTVFHNSQYFIKYCNFLQCTGVETEKHFQLTLGGSGWGGGCCFTKVPHQLSVLLWSHQHHTGGWAVPDQSSTSLCQGHRSPLFPRRTQANTPCASAHWLPNSHLANWNWKSNARFTICNTVKFTDGLNTKGVSRG